MADTVEIDEVDNKILHILISDARTNLTVIGKECGISSVSALNRIKRLKKLGVITGATTFPSISKIGFNIVATVGMQTDSSNDKILDFLRQYTYLIEPSQSLGAFDFSALVYSENIESLNQKIEMLKMRFVIKKVIVNVWSMPYMNFENVNLKPQVKG
jgi:Lrp/AsnC family transcriptional regulator, regulator for asnA, asnC and gidA